MNRTIVEKARSMLIESNLTKSIWPEAVTTAVYLISRLPNSNCVQSPEEVFTGAKPSVDHLRDFGCKAMAHIPKQQRAKFDQKPTNCILVGYVSN